MFLFRNRSTDFPQPFFSYIVPVNITAVKTLTAFHLNRNTAKLKERSHKGITK